MSVYLPKKPLAAPSATSEKTTPPEKLISLNLFFSVPPIYAIVTGSNDNEHGPRLVKSPALKIKNIVNGLGLLRPFCISRLPLWDNSEITKSNDSIAWIKSFKF